MMKAELVDFSRREEKGWPGVCGITKCDRVMLQGSQILCAERIVEDFSAGEVSVIVIRSSAALQEEGMRFAKGRVVAFIEEDSLVPQIVEFRDKAVFNGDEEAVWGDAHDEMNLPIVTVAPPQLGVAARRPPRLEHTIFCFLPRI